MKYATLRADGATEVREDSNPLPVGAFPLNNEQFEQLLSGQYILENNEIVINPNPPKPLEF